jgi:hypothetical protein
MHPFRAASTSCARRWARLGLLWIAGIAHAHQFKRANRALRKLKTYAGRVIRDIVRKIKDSPWLEPKFARRVLAQERGQRGPKVYSPHAPEVECIGRTSPTSSASRSASPRSLSARPAADQSPHPAEGDVSELGEGWSDSRIAAAFEDGERLWKVATSGAIREIFLRDSMSK